MLDVWDHFLNLIKIADMLSMPYWFPLSLETSSSRRSSQISLKSLLSSLVLTQSTIYPFDLIYHIPSHPIIIKSMFSFFILIMSGFAVIICSSADKLLFLLYYLSPKALDRLSPPLTLPKVTVPPALVILLISYGSYGLWSLLSSWAWPLTQATALESPALAQYTNSGVINTTLAVQPAWDSSSYLGPFSIYLIYFWILVIYCSEENTSWSILRKVYLSAC